MQRMLLSRKLRRKSCKGQRDQGYILITLMLLFTLLLMAAAVAVPAITFQIRRDREEELIHRGVQYARAIRRYYRKFGRYPTKLEDLESANNLRFLRKRYKDPITGQDFRSLRYGDVRTLFGAGLFGANPAGVPSLGGAANQNLAVVATAAVAANAALAAQSTPPADLSTNAGNASSNSSQTSTGDSSSANSSGSSTGTPTSAGGAGQTFGGGAIVGVASTSEKESIREYNKKNHYNDWQFIYVPALDRGGLLNTPAQPPLMQANGPQNNTSGPGGLTGDQGSPGQWAPGTSPQPPPPGQGSPQ